VFDRWRKSPITSQEAPDHPQFICADRVPHPLVDALVNRRAHAAENIR
jgi:hypothetical protein